MSLLKVENIQKSFGKTQVLRDISFSLEKGEVLAIIGSSGSGKTTLLRCLNFLETPQVGKISVNGEVLYDSSDKSKTSESEIRKNRLHFGLVFQSFNLFPQYKVIENITLAPSLRQRNRLKRAANIKEQRATKKLVKRLIKTLSLFLKKSACLKRGIRIPVISAAVSNSECNCTCSCAQPRRALF